MKSFFLAFILLLAIFMVACDGSKAPPIQNHSGPGVLETAPDSTLGDEGPETHALIETSIEELESLETQQIFRFIIKPVLTEVNRLGFPGEEAKAREDQFRSYFTWLGRAFTKVLQIENYEGLSEDQRRDLQEYLNYIIQDCHWNEDGEISQCLNLSFFRTIPQTLGFMHTYIPSRHDLSEYYNLMFLTYSLHIAQETEQTDLIYLRRARELLQSPLSDELRQKHLQTLSLILESSGESSEVLISFLRDFGVTDFLDDSDSPQRSQIFNLWLSKLMDSELKDNREFIVQVHEGIERSHSESGEELDDFDRVLRSNQINTSRHLEVLGLSEQSQQPSVFTSIILEKISLNTLSDSAKQNLLEFLSIGIPKEDLAAQIHSFSKLKLLALSLRSSRQLAQYFLNRLENQEDSPSRKKILKRALDQADQMSPRWNRYISELNSLKAAYRNYFSEHLTDLISSSPIREIMDDLEAIPRNINFYVSFPNMMLMMYYLADEDFSIRTYQFGRGVVTIDIKDIINVFFDGQYAPWFDFGTGTSLGVEYYELEMVFYYSLFFGLFDIYQVEPHRYFQLMIDKLLRPGFRSLQVGFNFLQTQFSGNENYEEFLANCRYHGRALCSNGDGDLPICGANSFLNQGRANPLKSNVWEITDYAFAGLPGNIQDSTNAQPIRAVGIHPAFMAATSLYWLPGREYLASAYNLDEFLERMRVDFTRRFKQIKRLSRVTANYLRRYKGEEAYLQFNERIEQQLQGTEQEVQNYLSHVIKWDSEVSLCTSMFSHLEFETQKELVKAESEFLRNVHQTLRQHRRSEKSESELRDALFPNAQNYSGIQGYDAHISGIIEQLQANPQSNYVYSKPLVLLRLREFLLSENFPIPGFTRREIHIPQSIEEFEFDGGIDLEVKDVSFNEQFSSFRRSVFDSYEFLANKDGRAWFKFASFSWFIRDWRRFKASLIKLGETPLSFNSPVFEETSCAEETSHFKACIDQVIDQNLRFNSLLFVDSEDEEILRLINKDRFVYRENLLHRSFFEYELGSASRILRYYAPLERLYYYVRKPFGGDIGERDQYKDRRSARNMPVPIRRRKIFDDAKKYYLYQAERPRMVFAPPSWLSLEIENYYRSTVEKEVEGIRSLGEGIERAEAQQRESGQFQVYRWIENSPPPVDNYDGGKIYEFNQFLETYHNQTKDFYRQEN